MAIILEMPSGSQFKEDSGSMLLPRPWSLHYLAPFTVSLSLFQMLLTLMGFGLALAVLKFCGFILKKESHCVRCESQCIK